MSADPVRAVAARVADNLVDTTRCQLARYGRHPIDLIARSPRTITDVRVLLDDSGASSAASWTLRHDDLRFFGSKVWQIVTSCRERRTNEYEKIGWWEFIDAEHRSDAYQKLLGHGITRSLVAAKAAHREHQDDRRHLRAAAVRHRHAGAEHRPRAERADQRRLDRSLASLPAQSQGVAYHLDSEVTAVAFDGQRIRAATVDAAAARRSVDGDYFVFALPVEDVIDLITPEMMRGRSGAGSLFTLDDITEWMNGIQIYLKRGRAARARPHHLPRLAVGAHLDLAGAVLERTSTCPATATARCGASSRSTSPTGTSRA